MPDTPVDQIARALGFQLTTGERVSIEAATGQLERRLGGLTDDHGPLPSPAVEFRPAELWERAARETRRGIP